MAAKRGLQVQQKPELETKRETKELQVQQKRELETKQETTIPARVFVPSADIYEDEDELTVILEMPGVDKGNVEVSVEDGILRVGGRLDFSKYEGLQPLYTEYNVGHYSRNFTLSNKIDQNNITAEMKDGVLSLKLPKAEEAKPRTIRIK
jgi:HSP20 family molecular chaperone IbpA